jgi:small-conductance mechanosensitive channel
MGYTDEEQEEKSRMLGGDVESVNAEIKMIREWGNNRITIIFSYILFLRKV